MEVVAAITAIIPLAIAVEGGVTKLATLIAALQAGGQLTADQVAQIRADRRLDDADYDSALADAKKELGQA